MAKSRPHNPRSHKYGLVVSLSPKRGPHIYWKKKPTWFNECVGEKMKKEKFGEGVGRQKVRSTFKEKAKACERKEKGE